MNSYSSYKDSGVEWIGNIPSDWGNTKLKYVSQLFTGNSLNDEQKKLYESENLNDIPYVSSKDIDVDFRTVNYDNGLRIPRDNNPLKISPTGSFLLCVEGGSSGRKMVFLDRDVCFVNKLCSFYSSQNTKFQYYFVQSSNFQDKFKLSLTGLIGGVSISTLKNFELPLPPLSEQTQIVSFLDTKTKKIDELIEKTEQKIELLKEKRTSLINHCVTKGLNPNVEMKDSGVEWIGEIPINWIRKKLGYIVNLQGRIGYKGYKKTDFVNEGDGCLVIGGKHLDSSQKLDLTNSDFLNWDKYYESPEIMVRKGDLIISQRGTLGKVVFIDKDYGRMTINPSLVLVNQIKENTLFLWYYLQSNLILTQIDLIGSVTTIPMLSQVEISSFQILIPPKEEQTQIVEYLDEQTQKIDSTIEKETQRTELLKEYRQSLISEVVTGKVDVRDYNG